MLDGDVFIDVFCLFIAIFLVFHLGRVWRSCGEEHCISQGVRACARVKGETGLQLEMQLACNWTLFFWDLAVGQEQESGGGGQVHRERKGDSGCFCAMHVHRDLPCVTAWFSHLETELRCQGQVRGAGNAFNSRNLRPGMKHLVRGPGETSAPSQLLPEQWAFLLKNVHAQSTIRRWIFHGEITLNVLFE